MFSKAKEAAAGTAKTPAPKKGEKAQIEIKGVNDYASVCAIIDALEAIKVTLGADVKKVASAHFVKVGVEKNVRPDNFRAIDGTASASVEMRKRSSRSALTSDEAWVLKEAGIETETVESSPAAFKVNPKYMNDEKLLEAVGRVLEKTKGIPEDFIVYAEAETTQVVGDVTIAQVFGKAKTAGKLQQLMEIVTTLALKPKVENMDVAMKTIAKLLK